MPIHLLLTYSCFGPQQQIGVVATERLIASKVENIYYLDLCRKRLLTPDLGDLEMYACVSEFALRLFSSTYVVNATIPKALQVKVLSCQYIFNLRLILLAQYSFSTMYFIDLSFKFFIYHYWTQASFLMSFSPYSSRWFWTIIQSSEVLVIQFCTICKLNQLSFISSLK